MLKNTSDLTNFFVKIVCYGPAGAGKTTLIKTLPNPVILTAEGGLLSLKDANIPFIEVMTLQQLQDAYMWLKSSSAAEFQSVAIDSISEIAEVVLSNEKAIAKDPRQAYGAMQETMTKMIRSFRDLDKHVYMTAKMEKTQDDIGRMIFAPSMPGAKLGQMLPYFFDEVMALRVEKDHENVTHRMLMTDGDGQWTAKDRSGRLDQWEAPDLSEIIQKIAS